LDQGGWCADPLDQQTGRADPTASTCFLTKQSVGIVTFAAPSVHAVRYKDDEAFEWIRSIIFVRVCWWGHS
jgi:hypothetical protein